MLLNLDALADYLIEEVDCSADYAYEDEFGIEFQGLRMFVQRFADYFRVELGQRVYELPRP